VTWCCQNLDVQNFISERSEPKIRCSGERASQKTMEQERAWSGRSRNGNGAESGERRAESGDWRNNLSGFFAKANSAFHPSGVGKWVPALAGKAKAGMVHSDNGWTRGVQVKLWDPLRTRAIPERLRGAFTTRRYRLQIHVYFYLSPLTLRSHALAVCCVRLFTQVLLPIIIV